MRKSEKISGPEGIQTYGDMIFGSIEIKEKGVTIMELLQQKHFFLLHLFFDQKYQTLQANHP